MSEDLVTVNTPETLGVTPRYILQYNAISRSAQNLSATAKKLTAMAMALLPHDLSSLTACFTFTEFCHALGYEKGGESYRIFKDAVEECMKCVITIESEPNKKGKKEWLKYTWFAEAYFNEKTGFATMTFSKRLADFLLDIKRLYTKINLKDIGSLQSKYAIRIFEIAMSYSSLKGKNGNKDETWFFERSIEELRFIMGVSEDNYKETFLFRQKVIEQPLKEINSAGIGVEIKTESIKKGRTLSGMRFNCKKSARRITSKGKKKKDEKQLELSDITLKTSDQLEEKELELLKERYPQEFAVFYQQALDKHHPFLSKDSDIRKLAAEGEAKTKLKQKYGIVK